MASAAWRRSTRFRGRHDRGPDQVPRLDRRLLGRPVLAPEGLHPGLHHRARLHGEHRARVRQARREDHRPLGRPARQTRGLGEGHRGDAGHRARTTRSSATPTSQVSKLYGMLPADVSGDAADRTPADNQTVRNVFVIGPDKKIKLILVYPMTTGRNFDEVLRVIDSLQLTAKHKVATPAQWQQGDDVIIAGSVTRRRSEGDSTRTAGRSRSPTSASSPSRRDAVTGAWRCPRSAAAGHARRALPRQPPCVLARLGYLRLAPAGRRGSARSLPRSGGLRPRRSGCGWGRRGGPGGASRSPRAAAPARR